MASRWTYLGTHSDLAGTGQGKQVLRDSRSGTFTKTIKRVCRMKGLKPHVLCRGQSLKPSRGLQPVSAPLPSMLCKL